MPAPITLWLETSHHAAFRVGGWAFVRREPDGTLSGQAGGERRTGAERIALAGLIAALKGLDGTSPVRLVTASPLVASIPARIAAAQSGEDPPQEDLDLWAQAMTTLAKTHAEIVAAKTPDRTTTFAAAWAELGRDRGKDKGAFASPIPKPNLAKSGA